jgi:hypothetical protein
MSAPKFCKDCKHSMLEPKNEWNLVCQHPRVIGTNAFALARPTYRGTDCSGERQGGWMAPCGKRGRLWEAK